ncbi:hypothetical protein HPP92_000079 [Vanilla planifolia]|uniref:Uncharacterized protein n=1 Tax=Vanilla planifolia TaxID=51239 RepID=A0A835S9I3_VANPL|nr:hypothetical protein HPP92_000079 [Vanilla planifolia]
MLVPYLRAEGDQGDPGAGKPLPRWKEPPEPARKSNSLRLSLLDLRAPAVAVFFSPIKPPLLMESDVSILVVVSVSQSIRTHQV